MEAMKLKQRISRFSSYLFFIAGIAVIVSLFPRKGKFGYEFQKGRPWMHEVLVAPFDFPIYKSEAQIQAERDSLLMDFQPFFKLDTTVRTGILVSFDNLFEEAWTRYSGEVRDSRMSSLFGTSIDGPAELKEVYRTEIIALLNQLYNHGIVEDPAQLERVNNRDKLVNVIKGQEVEVRQADRILSLKSAFETFETELKALSERLQPDKRQSAVFIRRLDPTPLIEANLEFDETTTNLALEEALAGISQSKGMIQSGEKVIALGEPVTEEKNQILESLRREYETNPGVNRNYGAIVVGQILLVAFTFVVLYLFLFHFRPEVLESGKKTFFIVMIVVILAFLASLTRKAESLNIYVVPFVILPIILKTFYDARVALFVHLVTILLIGFWAPNGFEFVFMNFIAGVVAIFTLRNVYRRDILFIAAVLAFGSYALVYTSLGLLQEGSFRNIELINFAWFGGNALLVLTSYPLIYIFEKSFGFISDATLVELSDTNQPLLRELAEKAPGTFQHSLQVANLSEAAARQVGANALMIRTGALYHDIGKMEDPRYFIENLTSNYNPHNELEFEISAEKIIGHVTRGIEIARKNKLPSVIIDFIRTHHGTTRVQYFYRSFIRKYPEAQVDIDKFTYPGPKPFSKETAILMMADSTEAASRSLKTIDKEKIHDLVENIIDNQMNEGQFENVDLTLKDFTRIKTLFKEKLANIYHARIEYPE